MGLVVKHVGETKAGTFHYCRRVPKEILEVIGKIIFKKKPDVSRKEALAACPRHHAEIDMTIAVALRRQAMTSGLSSADLSSTACLTARDGYSVALRRRADLIAD